MKGPKKVMLAFRVTPDFKEMVDRLAFEETRTTRDFVINAVLEHVKRTHDQGTYDKLKEATRGLQSA